MTAWQHPKLKAYILIAAVGLATGVVTGRPSLVAAGAPFLLYVIAALAQPRPVAPRVRLRLERERVLEGTAVSALLDVPPGGAERIDVALPPARGIDAEPLPAAFAATGDRRPLTLHAGHWGATRLGPVALRAWDGLGTYAIDAEGDDRPLLRIHPRDERLRTTLSSLQTSALTGSRRASTRGSGIEYAELRPYVPGDPIQHVNWRATARRGALVLTERHPERNADVVLVIDSFAEARAGGGDTTGAAVRAAGALADHHLRLHDRVGLVSLGAGVRWMTGSLGPRHRQRIADALIEAQAGLTVVFQDVDTIDRRVLPTAALVIVISPLLERRSLRAIRDLAARGRDLAVLEIDPSGFVAPPRDDDERLAREIWSLDREAQRTRLRRLGIGIARWEPSEPLEPALWKLEALRRSTLARSGSHSA